MDPRLHFIRGVVADLDAVEVYPAANRTARREVRAVSAQKVASASDGACFFHSTNRAADACEHCGRFLCALCALPVGGRTVCPTCVMEGGRSGAREEYVSGRALWDNRLVVLGWLPLALPPLWFGLPATGLLTLVLAAVHWKKPVGLMRRSRARFVAGAAGGLLLVAGVVFWAYLVA